VISAANLGDKRCSKNDILLVFLVARVNVYREAASDRDTSQELDASVVSVVAPAVAPADDDASQLRGPLPPKIDDPQIYPSKLTAQRKVLTFSYCLVV